MSQRSPTEELREEHEFALSQLQQFAAAVGRATSSREGPEADALRARLNELEQRMLLHFRKEEEALYPELQKQVAKGAPRADILAQFFGEAADDDLTAHRLLRGRLREMQGLLAGAARAQQAEGYSLEGLQAVASASLDLLTRHIEKENGVIFPMVERLLAAAELATAAAHMRRIAAEANRP